MAQLAPMQAAKLRGVKRAAERRAEAETAYRAAIRGAVAQRVPMRRIAEEIGINVATVHRIAHTDR